MNKMKCLYTIILLIIFTSNIFSMKPSQNIQIQQESPLLNLPSELLTYIIEQKDRETILNWNDIFQEPKLNINQMKCLAKTSKDLYHFYTNIFNKLKELKQKRFNELFEQLKEQAQREYQGLSKEDLNKALVNILNKRLQISEENFKTVVKLIFAGADGNSKDDSGKTALIYASKNSHTCIVELLINTKVDINIVDNNGETALIFASEYGHKKIVQMLMEAGAK